MSHHLEVLEAFVTLLANDFDVFELQRGFGNGDFGNFVTHLKILSFRFVLNDFEFLIYNRAGTQILEYEAKL